MIEIRFPEQNERVKTWQEQLAGLVVAHRFLFAPELSVPELRENDRLVEGYEAIEVFLKAFEADLDDWRTPRCGV